MADQEFELTAKLRIRNVTANDAKDLQTYCFTDHTVEEVAEELKADLARSRKGEVYRVIAEAGGHAIGNIRLERSPIHHDVGELSQLTVSPPFRQFQISDKLIEVTEQIAQENGIQMLQIEVPESETSIIAAYKKWGFAERPVVTLQKSLGTSEQEATTEEAEQSEESDEESDEDDEETQQELL